MFEMIYLFIIEDILIGWFINFIKNFVKNLRNGFIYIKFVLFMLNDVNSSIIYENKK